MKRRGITGIEEVGTLIEPRWGSMAAPCVIENVCSCARQVFMRIVLAKIGIILVRIFTSSTCVTVQTLHGAATAESLGIMAALSRHLQVNTMNY